MHPIIQKTTEDYNKIARHFSQTRYRLWPGMVEFKRFVRDGQRVMDWGCGNGRLLELFAGYKGIEYFGVDISAELLKNARRRHGQLAPNVKAHFYSTARRAKKFPDSWFDLIFMIASFHHLPDAESRLLVLHTCWRELAPGGRLVMMNWDMNNDWTPEKTKKGWKKIGTQDFLVPWKNPQGKIEVERFYHSFTPEELTELLTESGFTIEQTKYDTPTEWSDGKQGRNIVTIARK